MHVRTTAVPSASTDQQPASCAPPARRRSAAPTIAALFALCLLATATIPNVARTQDSSLATSPNTPPSSAGGSLSADAQDETQAEDMSARRGRGRGRRGGGGGRANRAALVTRLLGILTFAGAAGAAYAIVHVRRLSAALARLQDSVSSQARQLDEMRRRTGA